MEDDRREVQQYSRPQKHATDHEEGQESEGMNPKQADRLDAQPYDQQDSGEPERHGKSTPASVHSWGLQIFILSIDAAL